MIETNYLRVHFHSNNADIYSNLQKIPDVLPNIEKKDDSLSNL